MPPTPRKRKRSATTKTLATFATQLKRNVNEVSLLDLPAELRNAIYMMLLEGTKVRLSRVRSMKPLASESALPRVNKQVRNEFLSIALLSADIHTTSLDFDFRHIVSFLNRLSEAELQALSSTSTNIPSERTITVDLAISEDCPEEPDYFQRWLNRAGHPTKKGTNIDFQYKLVAGGSMLRNASQPWSAAAFKPRAALMAKGRQKEEIMKIVTALGCT
ncbi:hypothetical protein LTR85_003364 [Meristemomyces frigidus]|nr:hypothetical protein LTR85_003364 [Meristemomyces frigidus]